MPATASGHPSASVLAAFALGKLDASAAETIHDHLAGCGDCRTLVEATPNDSLLALLKRAVATTGTTSSPSQPGAATTGPKAVPNPSFDDATLPPELRDHPRYRILRKLGQGGMGTVYQAEHTVMERLVAVKVISPALVANPDALERFRREVRAAAKLDHPNIVKAYDAEQAGNLQLLAMEYVEGKSLAQVLDKKGPLPIMNACHYVRQAAPGLQHAFEKGMVHRDLKPQNLMLTPKGVVKILDFGLAKLASEQGRPGGGLTQENMVMGTPEYMAPEQAINTRSADVRADIYALGCTLYCLLTGRPPFRGEPLVIIVAHSQDAPPHVESLRPDVPEPLAALLQRLLAKDPARRPQTPKELAEALLSFSKAAKPAVSVAVARDPGAAKSGGIDPGSRHPRRWLVHGAVVAAALLAGGLLAGIVLTSKTKDGIVTLAVDPPDAEVVAEEGKITVTRKGDKEPYTITVADGGGKLRISKAGFQAESKEVTLSDKGQTLTVTLSPIAAGGPTPVPEAAPAPKGDRPAATALVPENTEWAGMGVWKNSNGQLSKAAAFTVTERHGAEFKGLFRMENAKHVVEGTVTDSGDMTYRVSQTIEAANPWPWTGDGEATKTLMTLRFTNTVNGASGRFILKRLPDGGEDFRFAGRWMCYDQPTGWKGLRPVLEDGRLFQGNGEHHWTRDGGLIYISFGTWLVIDPDNPNELNGSAPASKLTVRWLRQ